MGFFSDNTRVRIFFSPVINIRLYDKNSESDYFFSSTKIRILFQQHWESEYFFRKKNITPLQVKWSFPKHKRLTKQVLSIMSM